MKTRNVADNNAQRVNGGYTPRGIVTTVINGEVKTYPVSEVKIIPPKSGTAAVTPKK
jgi:hypothetical protein